MDPLRTKFVWFIYKEQPIEDIPRNITHLLVDPSVDEIEDDAFKNCKKLLSVVVPTTVRRIGKRAFSGCRLLSDVQLHKGLETIGDNAFGECGALESLTIPHGVISIGNYAFYWCEALEAISVPSTVQWIGCYSFFRCDSLVHVHLDEGIKSIGLRAFENCSHLVDINLPEGLQWIDFRTFGGCYSLCSVSMPSTMNKIGWKAFEGCSSLVHVRLNGGLKCIGRCAFDSCTALSGIALPSSLEEIENQAFRNCTGLLGFEIPSDSVVTISKDCFKNCGTSLVNVSIPSPAVDHWCLRLQQGNGACNRYDHLPIHKLCYNSTHTTTEELMQALQLPGILDDDKLKDAFDMTPFHIVATSSNLRADILECLLDCYPTDVLWKEDSQENTMMEYLLKNKSSKAIHLMRMVLYKFYDLEDICGWDIQAKEKFDFSDEPGVIFHDDETRQKHVKEMIGHLGYYHRIETRSVLEQALWKMKIDELQALSETCDSIDRASCRYRFGGEDVLKSVVGYLWDGKSSTYSTAIAAFPMLDFYCDSDSSGSSSYALTRWSDGRSSSPESGFEISSSESDSESSF